MLALLNSTPRKNPRCDVLRRRAPRCVHPNSNGPGWIWHQPGPLCLEINFPEHRPKYPRSIFICTSPHHLARATSQP